MAVVCKTKGSLLLKMQCSFFTVAGYTRESIDTERPVSAYFPGYFYVLS